MKAFYTILISLIALPGFGQISQFMGANNTPSPAALDTFISVWKTDNPGTRDNSTIQLPLINGGNYNFTVDWGDGNTDNITVWDDIDGEHTYSSAGTYTVKMYGTTIEGFNFRSGTEDATYQGGGL